MVKNRYKVPALGRAAEILDFLSLQNADFPTVVEKVGLPKSSVYSLIRTLEELGWVRKLPGTQGYALGFKLFELGNLAVSKINIRDQAMGLLHDLCEREAITCHLGCLDGNDGVYLAKVDPKTSILINSWEGKRVALKSSAMGKVFLAWRGSSERKTLIAATPFVARTGKTITDPDTFAQNVAQVRRDGFSVDDEEDVVGIRCVAAPVFNPRGEVNYAISASGSVHEVSSARVPELAQAVTDTARRLSIAIGAHA
ncbi:MAG: IclR family transcriptional regulator [Rhodospirillales bacterium]|jgi:DNA-binding IclR family transcriptional regulator|nr:IclR family transcriptional regulator [Rhodospirillales bacterium]